MRRRLLSLLLLAALAGCGAEKQQGPEDNLPRVLTPLKVDPPPALTAVIAHASEVSGAVELRHAGLPYWQSVTAAGDVYAEDWIRTGPGATVRLEFTNGAKLDVDESSVVVVELPEVERDSGVPAAPAIAVSKGGVRAVGEDDDKPAAPLLVKSEGQTQQVQLRGKGADLRVRATEAGTEIKVAKGTATVKRGAQAVELSEGHATVAAAELGASVEVPDYPVSVAPGIDARAFFPLEKPLALTWKPVPGVKGYRVQVARDLSFSVELHSKDVSGTAFGFTPDSKGLYVWRVAALAAGGVMSEYGFARRIYFEEEAPRELLLTPEDGETFGYQTQLPSIVFQWQAAAGAVSYRLSVSKSGDPQDKPVLVETTDAQRLEVSKLPAGEYHWGVYVRPGMKPIFLAPRKLVVKQMAKPKVKAPSSIQFE